MVPDDELDDSLSLRQRRQLSMRQPHAGWRYLVCFAGAGKSVASEVCGLKSVEM
jgi:hypothetical protein